MEKTKKLELYQETIKIIKALVNRQSADIGLWFTARYCTEAYLQQELRKLHHCIEENTRDL